MRASMHRSAARGRRPAAGRQLLRPVPLVVGALLLGGGDRRAAVPAAR